MSNNQPIASPPDDGCAELLRRRPAALGDAQAEASRQYRSARHRCPKFANVIDAAWAEAKARSLAADRSVAGLSVTPLAREAARVEQFRAASGAGAFFAALAGLTRDEIAELTAPCGIGIGSGEQARAVLAYRPALARWSAARDAQQTAREGVQAAANERARANMPRDLLDSLRRRGVALAIGDDGELVAPAGTDAGLILASEIEALRECKSQIVALLLAETEALYAASTPVVLVS
jgi:hypothetical protein